MTIFSLTKKSSSALIYFDETSRSFYRIYTLENKELLLHLAESNLPVQDTQNSLLKFFDGALSLWRHHLYLHSISSASHNPLNGNRKYLTVLIFKNDLGKLNAAFGDAISLSDARVGGNADAEDFHMHTTAKDRRILSHSSNGFLNDEIYNDNVNYKDNLLSLNSLGDIFLLADLIFFKSLFQNKPSITARDTLEAIDLLTRQYAYAWHTITGDRLETALEIMQNADFFSFS